MDDSHARSLRSADGAFGQAHVGCAHRRTTEVAVLAARAARGAAIAGAAASRRVAVDPGAGPRGVALARIGHAVATADRLACWRARIRDGRADALRVVRRAARRSFVAAVLGGRARVTRAAAACDGHTAVLAHDRAARAAAAALVATPGWRRSARRRRAHARVLADERPARGAAAAFEPASRRGSRTIDARRRAAVLADERPARVARRSLVTTTSRWSRARRRAAPPGVGSTCVDVRAVVVAARRRTDENGERCEKRDATNGTHEAS